MKLKKALKICSKHIKNFNWSKLVNKENPLPTLYDRHNKPLKPPKGSRYSKKKHKYQKASLFTEEETEEILKRESIKGKELKL